MTNDEKNNGFYRLLPSVNDLLLTPGVKAFLRSHSHDVVASSIRNALSRIRKEISDGQHTDGSLEVRLASLEDGIVDELLSRGRYSLRPVINGTGVILHTNLGRASLSQAALDHIVEVAKSYCNLEFDLASGDRGSRDIHVESLILHMLAKKTGTIESPDTRGAVVVNNCAAATFIALNTLAEGKEVLISRGELVEIGGGFRVPEILKKSGASLREVGTTNRTRLTDYEQAISSATGLILRVHQSNFSMQGFVTKPRISELVALGRRANVPVFEDQGTGLVCSLEEHGIQCEETLLESYRQGCDLIAASGDKLLGGPQCGLLIGRRELIQRIRQNPLLRTYRVDKLTYAALEATVLDHLSGTEGSIPTFRMINLGAEEIRARCQWIADQIHTEDLFVDVVPAKSLIGGGTTPEAMLSSYALSLHHVTLTADELLAFLRESNPPVIGRISEGCVLLDLRTIDAEFDTSLAALLNDRQAAIRASAQMSDR
jgi:L-seryl-tRNA(Ser) seleniumtransferase